jgi:hypothetical protein
MNHYRIKGAAALAAILLGVAGAAESAVSEVDGAGGGGIVPWALLSGDSADRDFGAVASYTYIDSGDFNLHSAGVAGSIMHWVELSYAHWYLGLPSDLSGALGTNNIQADVLGAKLKLLEMGDGMPQIAFGVQYKHNSEGDLVKSLGAKSASGTDFYLAATKVTSVGGRNVLLDGTLRATKANWMGLLGFGADGENGYKLQFEGSAGVFLNEQTLLGVEYRGKPNNLHDAGLDEDDIGDAFIAYFPNKNLAIVGAYANLGQIATPDHDDQHALYLQLQASF